MAVGAAPSPVAQAAQRAYQEEIKITGARRPKLRYFRFLRSFVFFAITTAEVVLFEIVLRRIFPEAIARGRLGRTRGFARRFRRHAVRVGGVMIKLGQFLSSRVDIIPREIIEELAGLQDEVPPAPAKDALRLLKDELSADPSEIFAEFNTQVHAAASLGQVYKARLKTGEKVIVKVQRPGIIDVVATDLVVLRMVARWTMYWAVVSRRADMPALLEEFAETLWQELNYLAEADNAERFQELFSRDVGVYIPGVYRRYSTDKVITLEDVTTLKISDVAGMVKAGIDPSEAAQRLLDVYLRMIFDFGLFHADPHPGNLFIYPLPDADADEMFGPGWRHHSRPFYIIFVDFGMVGRVTERVRQGLWEMMIAVGTRDGRRMMHAYELLGVLLPTANLERVMEAQTEALEQIWGKSTVEMVQMSSEEMAYFARKYRDLLYDMPFQVPQNFIYLGRAMGMLSGLCVSIDPHFNAWGLIGNYARRFILQESRRNTGSLFEVARIWISERLGQIRLGPGSGGDGSRT